MNLTNNAMHTRQQTIFIFYMLQLFQVLT